LSGTFSKVHAGTSGYTPYKPNNCNSEIEKTLNTPCGNGTDVSNVGVSELEQNKRHRVEGEAQKSEIVDISVDTSGEGNSRFEKIRRRLFVPGTPENGLHVRSSDISDWVNERSKDPFGFGSLPGGPTPRILTDTSVETLSSLDSVSTFLSIYLYPVPEIQKCTLCL
jgi:hypothetical protein